MPKCILSVYVNRTHQNPSIRQAKTTRYGRAGHDTGVPLASDKSKMRRGGNVQAPLCGTPAMRCPYDPTRNR